MSPDEFQYEPLANLIRAIRPDDEPTGFENLKEDLKSRGLDADSVAKSIEANISSRQQHSAAQRVHRPQKWRHPSVLRFAAGENPVSKIISCARTLLLSALQGATQEASVDPLALAKARRIPVVPNEAISDARLVPVTADAGRIEYNPNRPRTRLRFSVAHELAHTFFEDCWQTVRNRQSRNAYGPHEWELEMLCNLAAGELLMPITSFPELRGKTLDLDQLLSLRERLEVSVEALLNRVARITSEPCIVFAASQIEQGIRKGRYRLEYAIPSRSWLASRPSDLLPTKSRVAECTAIGFTAKGSEIWPSIGHVDVEVIGVLPHRGNTFPRVVGIARPVQRMPKGASFGINYLRGDAMQPRGDAPKIVAYIVNDKTPNWGGGFALAIRKQWPRVQTEFQRWVSNNDNALKLGNTHHVAIDDDTIAFPMICQHGYGPAPTPRLRYAALQECLDQLAQFTVSLNGTIHMPRIGSGFAGGSWGLIEELIDQTLCSRSLAVTVYDLPGTRIQPKQQQPSLFD